MPLLADYYLDLALNGIDTDANRLDICSQEPTTYAQATSTYTLGNKTSPTVSAAADASPNGRAVTVSAITDGTVTGTDTATHWALTSTSNSRLIATNALTASQAVTSGNTFTLAEFTIRLPDAVSQ